MRLLAGLVSLSLLAVRLPVRADEPAPVPETKRQLLDLEARLTAAHDGAGRSVACVVVSRSDKYPKPAKPPAHAGQLGDFDRAAFVKADPAKTALADRLDLSDRANIPDHGSAGGVVIDPAGLILTNYHTIDGATKVYVHLPGGKGSYADIHAADSRCDLAVLKLLAPPDGLKPVPLGEARTLPRIGGKPTLVPGKLVVLVGCSPATPEAAVWLGTVTTLRMPPPSTKDGPERSRSIYKYSPVVEFEARSVPKVSGTAVLNLDGELVGLTTTAVAAAEGESGAGCALPIDANLRRIIDVLRRGEEVEYGFLGVSLPTEPRVLGGRGLVVNLTTSSPAAAAGLRDDDPLGDPIRLTRLNDYPVKSYDDLLVHVGSALAGSRVRLTVERRAGEQKFDVTLGKFKLDTPFIASVRPEPVFGLRIDYGTVVAQTPGDGPRGVPNVAGVVVRELVPDSPAAAKFKALGENTRWLVTDVNGTPVRTPADFYKAAAGRAAVTLTVIDPTAPSPRPRELKLP